MVSFILTISTVAAVNAVDQRLLKTARSFGASKPQVWTQVIFPAVLPQVFTMLRINFFAAWMAVLAAEMVGVKNGLGMMIILGAASGDASDNSLAWTNCRRVRHLHSQKHHSARRTGLT